MDHLAVPCALFVLAVVRVAVLEGGLALAVTLQGVLVAISFVGLSWEKGTKGRSRQQSAHDNEHVGGQAGREGTAW